MKKRAPVRRFPRLTFRPRLESLETRLTPTTYTVSSLADSGTGSLRAAITSVNADSAADQDEIDFSVAGVIKLTSGALPTVTNLVNVNGRSAPGFTSSPVIEIDNNGFTGLVISGASNSTLAALSIVNANGAGVTLHGQGFAAAPSEAGNHITIVGNYIGLALDGSVAGNSGVGLLIDNAVYATIGGGASSDRNVISGNGSDGIQIGPSGQATIAFVINNYIGTNPSGQSAASNLGNGIKLLSNGNNIGSFQGYGNTIAFNKGAGVLVDGGVSNPLQSNSIFSNGGAGIQLVNSGNENQPAPRLTYVVEAPGSTPGTIGVQVGGVVNGPIVGPYTVQVFATLGGVPSGQGQIILGWVQVNPNVNGTGIFTLSASIPAGGGATFTATLANTTSDFNSASNTSEFSNPLAVGTPNQVYVAHVYQLLLDRAPDANSAVWVNALNNGVSAAAVVLGVESSSEYLSDQVTALYRLYLARIPDTEGGQAWTNFLLAGGTLEQVAVGLTNSQEYYQLRFGTDENYILGLYSSMLQRLPSQAELVGWEIALNNGLSRPALSGAIVTSREYRADLVQSYYLTFLQRSADAAGVAAWVNALNAGATDQQVLAQIFGSAEGYQLWS
jgi:hypothetical protein